MTATITRVLEKFLSTPAGREVEKTIENEDLDARRAHVKELQGARRWLDVELERLGALRRDAEVLAEKAKGEYEAAALELRKIEVQTYAVRVDAEIRASAAVRELKVSADDRIAALVWTLHDLAKAMRRQAGNAVPVEKWENRPESWNLVRVVYTDARLKGVFDILATIRPAIERVEALALEALTSDELTVRLYQVRADLDARALANGTPLPWPSA